MNEVIEIYPYSNKTARVAVNAPTIAERARPGHFVILRFSEEGPRIPFSIVSADSEKGIIEIIIHRAAGLDDILQYLRPGRKLVDLLGPLGKPAPLDRGRKVICVGDGSGFVSMLPIIKALYKEGCEVVSVVSEESAKASCLTEDIDRFSTEVVIVKEGELMETVARIIDERGTQKMWMAGPTMTMKQLTALAVEKGIKASCILNMLMLDGIGLCGICRVYVGGERKQTCTDGPTFNAKLVDFDQLYNRQRLFK